MQPNARESHLHGNDGINFLMELQDWELAILKPELNGLSLVCMSGKIKSGFSPALYWQQKVHNSIPEEREN